MTGRKPVDTHYVIDNESSSQDNELLFCYNLFWEKDFTKRRHVSGDEKSIGQNIENREFYGR